jgi:hypothetical protein
MKAYIFNVILGFLALAVLLLPFTGKVHDGRFRWFKGFTKRGWVVLIAFVVSIVVNYLKDMQADKDEATRIEIAKVEKKKDDSISRKRNDESNSIIVNTFTDALAKHGLKYDSAEKVIQKLVKDSSKKEIKYTYGNHPELAIYNIELTKSTNDSLIFKVTFYTKQAAAYNTTVKSYLIFEPMGKSLYFIPQTDNVALVKNILIPLDKILELPRYVMGDATTIRAIKEGTVYFVFIGDFFDSDNKRFPFKVIESYSNERKFGSISESAYINVRNLLHEKGIDY